jgi:hypothetical protein
MTNRFDELNPLERSLVDYLINTIAAHSLSDSGSILTAIISETQNKIRDAKGASA